MLMPEDRGPPARSKVNLIELSETHSSSEIAH